MAKTWVVYRRPTKDDPAGAVCVCSQAEWAALTRGQPGIFTLVRDGIGTEGEAERVGRQEAVKRVGPIVPAKDDPDQE